MSNKEVEIYFKEKIREHLNRIKKFEEKLIKDSELVEENRAAILSNKANKDGKYEDVREELIAIQKLHYYSFFLEQSYKYELVRVEELITAATILKIDLGLEGEDELAVKNITSGQSRVFNVDNKGDVVILDGPMKDEIEKGIEPRLSDENVLKDMYNNVSPVMRR